MQTIYLDNASTSFPKAPGVGDAMKRYVDEIGMNVSRGAYQAAMEPEGALLTLRERLCGLLGSDCVEGCILTPGATYGLNMALNGLLKPGDHVLLSPFEHNAVMRPLHQLGAQYEIVPCLPDGTLDAREFEQRIRPDTALVACVFASNVSGMLSPIGEIGAMCQARGVPFLVDASQAVGHLPIDCKALHVDALVFGAHKGLLGPQGIGAALCTRELAERLSPFVTGGTGSLSHLETQPLQLPDKLEAGTPNLPGAYGFLAALDHVETHAQEIAEHEKKLLSLMLGELRHLRRARVLGACDPARQVGVVSVDFVGQDNAEIALRLEREYGILTRCGLHCAPEAHKALGTYLHGTVRFSLGYKTTEAEALSAVEAIRALE